MQEHILEKSGQRVSDRHNRSDKRTKSINAGNGARR